MKCVTTHASRLQDIVNNERCRHKEKLALIYRTRRLGCPLSISQNHTKSSHFLYYQPVSCTKYITFTSFKQKDDIVTSCWISILVLDAPDDEKDKIMVICFSPELTWLYCGPLWALYRRGKLRRCRWSEGHTHRWLDHVPLNLEHI